MRMRKEIVIMALILVAIVGLGIILLKNDKGSSATAIDSASLVKDDSHMTGSKNAKVTIVEFGDYQCPSCAAAEPIIERLLQQYQSNPNFNFVFRNFPLPQHANAQVSAEAAEAAGAQGKFWEMHNKIYENQNEWSENSNALSIFSNYAQQLGLNVDKFIEDVRNSKFKNFISADASEGTALNINATPTFFVNGVMQVGVPDYDALKKNIDDLLGK